MTVIYSLESAVTVIQLFSCEGISKEVLNEDVRIHAQCY